MVRKTGEWPAKRTKSGERPGDERRPYSGSMVALACFVSEGNFAGKEKAEG